MINRDAQMMTEMAKIETYSFLLKDRSIDADLRKAYKSKLSAAKRAYKKLTK